MLTVETKYFIENGDVARPFIQTRVLNPALQVVSTGNLAQPGDIEVTEPQYDSYVATIEGNVIAQDTAIVTAKLGRKNAATPALLGIGLTLPQIDEMFT